MERVSTVENLSQDSDHSFLRRASDSYDLFEVTQSMLHLQKSNKRAVQSELSAISDRSNADNMSVCISACVYCDTFETTVVMVAADVGNSSAETKTETV